MKTRIIQTRFWEDDEVRSVQKNSRYLWIFLLTNDKLGMTNYFKIPDVMLMYYTELDQDELSKAKIELEERNKVFFHNDWIFIPNLEKENKYRNSPKLQKPYEDELSHIPQNIISYFSDQISRNSTIDSSIDSTIDTPIKQKTINQKQKTKNKKEEYLQKILATYNKANNCSIKSTLSWEKNALKWLDQYTIEEVITAIEYMNELPFIRDKVQGRFPLDSFFRTTNDWIGQCLEIGLKKKKKDEDFFAQF